MMDNRYQCGCERGGDCTKTTMCKVQAATEDYVEVLERVRDILRNDLYRTRVRNALAEIDEVL